MTDHYALLLVTPSRLVLGVSYDFNH